jgi:Flp pilus assembly pilin Flp
MKGGETMGAGVGALREAAWVPAGLYVRAKLAARHVWGRIRDGKGQTGFEYFLIAAGVAVLVGAAVLTFGTQVKSGITQATQCLNSAQGIAGGGSGGTGVCS